jgi:hypothetical protein
LDLLASHQMADDSGRAALTIESTMANGLG